MTVLETSLIHYEIANPPSHSKSEKNDLQWKTIKKIIIKMKEFEKSVNFELRQESANQKPRDCAISPSPSPPSNYRTLVQGKQTNPPPLTRLLQIPKAGTINRRNQEPKVGIISRRNQEPKVDCSPGRRLFVEERKQAEPFRGKGPTAYPNSFRALNVRVRKNHIKLRVMKALVDMIQRTLIRRLDKVDTKLKVLDRRIVGLDNRMSAFANRVFALERWREATTNSYIRGGPNISIFKTNFSLGAKLESVRKFDPNRD